MWSWLNLLLILQFFKVLGQLVYSGFFNFLDGGLDGYVFPPRTTFAVFHRFSIDMSSFSLVSMNCLSSSLISWLIQAFLSKVVFSFQVFEFLLNFSLWLSSSFKALWSENMQGIISVFWYQLSPDLWPSMWSILEKVPCALEKNEYSVVLGWNVLYISMRSIWSNVSFKALVSLLIFCLDDLS